MKAAYLLKINGENEQNQGSELLASSPLQSIFISVIKFKNTRKHMHKVSHVLNEYKSLRWWPYGLCNELPRISIQKQWLIQMPLLEKS